MNATVCVGATLAVGALLLGCNAGPPAPPALADPSAATERAPDTFRVVFDTTKGAITATCTREWAPNGVDRLYNLVKRGFFDDVAFFRVVTEPRPFVAQFGLHGIPAVNSKWSDARIAPDPVKASNDRGKLTFAMAGSPDTRTTQLFINLASNKDLDRMGFAPICEIDAAGMAIADQLYGGYGEGLTEKQGTISSEGNAFLKKEYPRLDYIKTARVE
ncbi:MAG: peptidylprolyl isomerase [Polyangiaceae bacterium]